MTAQTVSLDQAGSQAGLQAPLPSPKKRLYYLDNLRTVLITGVVLGHLSVTYGVDADWIYYEGGEVNSVIAMLQLLLLAVGISFALGLFFMVAGYFTPAAYDRKGTGRFVVDRLIRLGIPWLFYEVFINPFIHYAVDVHGGDCQGALYDCQYRGTLGQYLKDFPRLSGSIGDGPVWFLEALLIFSLFYALWRKVTERDRPPALSEGRPIRNAPGSRSIALFALLIGLSTFFLRFWFQALVQYEPLHLEYARFPQYMGLFLVGIWAYRHDWLASFSDLQARLWAWVALACLLALPFLLAAFGAHTGDIDERAMGGPNLLSLAFSVWEGFLCVSMSITLLAWFRRRMDHQGRLARSLSEASFGVYVLHPAIIVPLTLALSGMRMNLSLKFLFVAPLAVALCYLAAGLLRKAPLAKTVLG